ncbi:hypothetical protein [Photobacterium leiognathi]|uniref:hypothetical protein n=1 Tax=Photobacterium leiognathi TaxID=553611 RepID=UPI002981E214|nr:hypothetical protein [Photobacterium leiognathi]
MIKNIGIISAQLLLMVICLGLILMALESFFLEKLISIGVISSRADFWLIFGGLATYGVFIHLMNLLPDERVIEAGEFFKYFIGIGCIFILLYKLLFVW